MAKYRTLKAGDVRQLGDQYRQLWNSGRRKFNISTAPPNPPDHWSEVSLISHPILPADLFNAEFRRRIS